MLKDEIKWNLPPGLSGYIPETLILSDIQKWARQNAEKKGLYLIFSECRGSYRERLVIPRMLKDMGRIDLLLEIVRETELAYAREFYGDVLKSLGEAITSPKVPDKESCTEIIEIYEKFRKGEI